MFHRRACATTRSRLSAPAAATGYGNCRASTSHLLSKPPAGAPRRKAGAVATPSIPPRIRTLRVRRALGGGQLPVSAEARRLAPGGRAAGEPLDLGSADRTNPQARLPPPRLVRQQPPTLPPSATPRDEFDLGIGYMQRKDYALAEEDHHRFAQKYPGDPLMAVSQFSLRRELS